MRKNRRRNFISTMLLCDVFICIICPIPFFELHYNESNFVQGFDSSDSKAHATYLLSDFILTFMFLRLYLVIRNVFNHTQFSDPYAKLHCERHGFTANTRFCFKCYLQKYPATTIFTTLFISVFALSYVNRISERPMFKVVSNFPYVSVLNNVYAVIITMTTVGFGDYVPYTWMGKIFTLFTALWGGFIISLAIVSVNDIFSLSAKQKVAFEKLIRVRYAARSIVSAFRYQVAKNKMIRFSSTTSFSKTIVTEKDLERLYLKFLKNIKKFRDVSDQVKFIKEKNESNIKMSNVTESFNMRFEQ